jgi:putative two-component system response regulator
MRIDLGDTAHGRILVIDDEPANTILLQRVLAEHGYRSVTCINDPRAALAIFLEDEPDVILLDLNMPHMDGYAVLAAVRAWLPPDAYLPILVLTGDATKDARHRALAAGATDFLTKPFDATEVALRVRNVLQTRKLHLEIQSHNALLEQRVDERTREVEESRLEMLELLGQAIECRDDVTHQHTLRVGDYTSALARDLRLPPEHVSILRRAAPLHDIGKIGVPDAILLKPGRLTPEEFEVMKTHTTVGARILSKSKSDVVRLAETIAQTHHERWDGRGYLGLSGESIPFESRIVSVADVFDALTHPRPYKPAWPLVEAVAEIERQAGYQFDPRVVTSFMRVLNRGEIVVAGASSLEREQHDPESAAIGAVG